MHKYTKEGKLMYKWLSEIFPYNRSVAGPGNLKTLKYFKKINNKLNIKYIKSGTKIYDWKVPKEWHIKNAFIEDKNSNKVVDFRKNNLSILNYSSSINKTISLKLLKKHIFTLKNQPDVIPYVTSYYSKRWGFCMKYNDYKKLKDKNYYVRIDSKFIKGKMHYGEIIIKGKTTNEILLSTNICHPSMANNELSGPVLTLMLSNYLKTINNWYTYRIIFIPETIGSIAYLNKNKKNIDNIVGGFNIVCVGDDNNYSLLKSRYGNTISDKIAESILKKNKIKFKTYSYLERGSDERQYCSPGIDLPIASVMRSKYGTYKEYHTSDDNLHFVSWKGLSNSYKIYVQILNTFEKKRIYKYLNFLYEPFLTKYSLYPDIGTTKNKTLTKDLLNFLAYADGNNDLEDIAKITKIKLNKVKILAKKLEKIKIIK